MRLKDALEVLGVATHVVCTRQEGYEMISHMLFAAIMEEWLDGLDTEELSKRLPEFANTYGSNVYKQAARIVANKVDVYGDYEY